jgi:hypothetical protein
MNGNGEKKDGVDGQHDGEDTGTMRMMAMRRRGCEGF